MDNAYVDAALGKIPCDLVLKNAEFLDVFQCEWFSGDISVFEGRIVGIEPGLKGKRTVDLSGGKLVPGFIDAHVHLESSMMTPSHFQDCVLPRGTTSVVSDPHELANVLGQPGIKYFLDAAENLSLDLHVMLSSCVPATNLETNGGGALELRDLNPLRSHPKALGLAEMMNVPGVLMKDPGVWEKLRDFQDSIIDGHAPLLKGRELSAYASAGISSCHESSELAEAQEKLRKGLSVWIREGSVAKDLQALHSLIEISQSQIGFCTDDRNPLDILEEGHLDYLIRRAMHLGADPKVAYRASSFQVARHYGLHRGPNRKGAIAPGFKADLVWLADEKSCSVKSVWKNGILSSELPLAGNPKSLGRNTVVASVPDVNDLKGPEGAVHVIEVIKGKIITGRSVDKHDAAGVQMISVLERYGRGSKPANAYVRGFGNLRGAIASSVGHDSHNLIVVGSNPLDMKVALAAVIQSQGGFSVANQGYVVAELALPIGGLMSELDPQTLAKKLKDLKFASRQIGCELDEPFLHLAFLSLPVIPKLKLTDKGLVDVEIFDFIPVRAS